MTMERLIVTPDECATLLREKKCRVMDYLESGEIPAYRSGSYWKIPLKTLEHYIENKAISEARARKEMKKNET